MVETAAEIVAVDPGLAQQIPEATIEEEGVMIRLHPREALPMATTRRTSNCGDALRGSTDMEVSTTSSLTKR